MNFSYGKCKEYIWIYILFRLKICASRREYFAPLIKFQTFVAVSENVSYICSKLHVERFNPFPETMVIQRWQSLLLFISALIAGFALIFPVGPAAVDEPVPPELFPPMQAFDVLPLFILLCLSFVLLLADIFLFFNLQLQKTVALVCVLLLVVAGVVGGICGGMWVVAATAVSAILAFVAYMRIRADERLLKSYDRIR